MGSVSITIKLSSLTELAGNLGVLQDRLEDTTLHLQRRNTQIHARALPRHEEVTVHCLNCPEMAWLESISFLEDAPQSSRIGSPLTVKQLLQSASLLQEMNALPLSHLLT